MPVKTVKVYHVMIIIHANVCVHKEETTTGRKECLENIHKYFPLF